MRRRTALLVVAACAAVAAGCQQGEDGPRLVAGPVTTASTTTSTLRSDTLAPLTGLPMDEDDVDRAAVTVKVDNSPEARPQSGIDIADVVYEEKVEGTVVRFLAVFHSRDADLIGPVRSVRSSDPPIVAPLGGVFAYSGGIPSFVSQIRKVATAVSEADNADAFKLRSDRRRPYKTYGSSEELRELADDDDDPPPEMFPRLREGEAFAPDGAPASRAVVVFGSRTTAQWDWDAATETWKRTTNGTPHVVEEGGQLAFPTVILQSVPYRGTQFRDTSGGQVDQAVVTGTGKAIVLAAGRRLDVTWSKSADAAVTRYLDATGGEAEIPPGAVWVSLPPTGASITVT